MYKMNAREQATVDMMNELLGETTVELLWLAGGGHIRFPMRINSPWMKTDIQELELSVRSFNCLRRAGIGTVGELVDRISCTEDLHRIRNLGKKSAHEIMMALFTGQFLALEPEKRKRYMMEVWALNS